MSDPRDRPPERRPLAALQPSQLLVSAAKLRRVLGWWEADDPDPEPIPYLDPVDDVGLDPSLICPGGGDPDRVVLADGHTRALAAVLTGAESLPVVRDPDREELSTALYRECVGWCVEAGVREPADLVGRVVSESRFRAEWVDRCRARDDGA